MDDELNDTGPFCEHFSDPPECDELCLCGHQCCEHDLIEPRSCQICECADYEDEHHKER